MDKSTLYDASLYQYIRQLADRAGIPNQTKSLIAGGNDAAAIQRSANGVRVAAISIPCRYIHSPSGVISWTDVENVYHLLELLVGELPQ
jgi:endoglucanase